MWKAIGFVALFVLIMGVVECKKCPYKKWLCYAASEDCRAHWEGIPGVSGISGRLKSLVISLIHTVGSVITAIKNKLV